MNAPRSLEAPSPRAQELFDEQWRQNARRTDRMFAVLMLLQWGGAVVASLILSPQTWSGLQSQTHPHVWLSLWLGGALASLPIYFAWRYPGATATRYVIAMSQMLFSSLLIHISGGRIETHFHVFGSLAFLAFYRDWKVLLPPTMLVAADHFVRGVYWPETVFGITTASPWRWVEHAAWVIYLDVFLIMSCRNGVREMWQHACRTADLERINREMRSQKAELEQAYLSKNAIVETALDAVISIDSEGRITGWNSQAEAIFGWTRDECLGGSLAELIIPHRYCEAHRKGMANYLATGEGPVLNRRLELSALRRNGEEFPVELTISPTRSGEKASFCAFLRDITERHQAADAMRKAKEAAEAASNSKSAFLAHMSHEIRTPLNGILGFTDLLLGGDAAGDTLARREYLETIHDSGRHLLCLINDILDLSKIESGRLEVERVRCCAHEVVAEVCSILRVRAQERGLALEYLWKGPVPDTIETDPARLRQVLMNLIGNAIKFTDVGSVQVLVRLCQGDDPRLVVDVIDTGVGIETGDREQIFEPFVQADNSVTRRFGGTGLGLPISRQLVRLLGGELSLVSEPGRGSIFTFSVATGPLEGVRLLEGPVSDFSHRRLPAHDQARSRLPACRVLLVEDGVTNRKLLSLMLQQAGVAVETAENGLIGVDLALAEPFDLILMDMQMPVKDGYTATRELRKAGLTLPILALTAHAMLGDEEKCREAGCSGYLTKPIESHRLLRAVAEALGAAQPEASSPDQSPPDETPHDERIVSTLLAEEPEFREVVEDFVQRLQEQVAAMREAWQCRDFGRLAQLAHWLKGSAGTAGFDAFTLPAAELERLVGQRDEQAIPPLLAQLDSFAQRIELPATV